jgi:hypothetical protein
VIKPLTCAHGADQGLSFVLAPLTRSTTDTEVNAMRKSLWITVGLSVLTLTAITVGIFFVANRNSDAVAQNSPLHRAAATYLDAAEEGRPLIGLYGRCATQAQRSGARELLDDTEGRQYEIVGSTATDGTATVNVEFSASSSAPSPYSLDMRREGGKWKVCALGTGHVQIGVAPL